MSALAVTNAARELLTPLGYPVLIADTLQTDASGLLTLPDAASVFVIHAITRTPQHAWGSVRYGTTRIQVDAFSRVEGEALALLALAEPALVAGKFIPLPVVSLGRDGSFTGYAQDFERHA